MIANKLAEHDVDFISKLNPAISDQERQDVFTSRFNYYKKVFDGFDEEERVLIDDSNEERTLIEDYHEDQN